MKKTEKVITEEFKSKTYCDVCGNVTHANVYCVICKKDLCCYCIAYKEDDGSDYSDCWCKNCWELGKDYRVKIKQLGDEIDRLTEEWHKKCKNQ